MPIRFLAVDGFNLIRRIFEARHASSDQDMVQVIEAAKASLGRALKRHEPSHAAVVLEHHDKTWRHLLYPAYKQNRSETPPLLLNNLAGLTSAFLELGVSSFGVDSYEADDVIATVSTVVAAHQGEVVILSTDKVYLQLVSGSILVYDHFNDKACNQAYIEQRYNIQSQQYLDYLALVGDKSNNVKGVPGIGSKGAASLLEQYGSLDRILTAAPDTAQVRKVQEARAEALRCRQLVSLKTDVELGQNLKSFRLIETIH